MRFRIQLPIIHNHPLHSTTGLQRWLKVKGKQYRWWNLISVHPQASLEDPFLQPPSFISHERPQWTLISCHLWWDDLMVKSNYSSGKEITRNMQIPSPLLWQGTKRGNSSIIPTDGIHGRFFTPWTLLHLSGGDNGSYFEVIVETNFTKFCICQKGAVKAAATRLRSKQCVCVVIHLHKNTCVGSS